MAPEASLPGRFPKEGLTGRSLRLLPFAESDITESYVGWLNDPQVVRFSNQRFRKHDRDSSRAYLASFEGTDNLFLAVRRAGEGDLIGTLTAYVAGPHGTADVGIMMGNAALWGQGWGQDAWNTLVDWLLSEAGLRKVTAGTLACNIGMLRVFERAGMHHEATRKAQEVVEGRPEDILYYAKFSAG